MYDDILGPSKPKDEKEPKNKINLKSGESVSGDEEEIDIENLVLEMEDSNPVDPDGLFDDDEDEDMWDLGLDEDDCDCDEGC